MDWSLHVSFCLLLSQSVSGARVGASSNHHIGVINQTLCIAPFTVSSKCTAIDWDSLKHQNPKHSRFILEALPEDNPQTSKWKVFTVLVFASHSLSVLWQLFLKASKPWRVAFKVFFPTILNISTCTTDFCCFFGYLLALETSCKQNTDKSF